MSVVRLASFRQVLRQKILYLTGAVIALSLVLAPLTGAAPIVTSISPDSGPASGGTTVTIDGSGFMGPTTWKQVGAGDYHSCAIAENDWAYCWGANWYGQSGTGSNEDPLLAPAAIDRGEIPDSDVTIKYIQTGSDHTCALASNNQVYCWGYNANGQLGNGTTTGQATPVLVSRGAIPTTETIETLSVASEHACVITDAGNLYCWGKNNNGELGDGTQNSSSVPVAVQQGELPANFQVSQLVGGGDGSCVLTEAGWVYCWGFGQHGQLGNGYDDASAVPVAIARGEIGATETIKTLSVGSFGSCVISDQDKVYCWGYNGSGQLGNGTTGGSSNVPVAVTAGEIPSSATIYEVAAGGSHVCAVDQLSRTYCWGFNSNGQLGNGTIVNSAVPTAVLLGEIPTGTVIGELQAAQYSTCVLSTDGALYCWGYNSFGQLGNGTTAYRVLTPVGMDIAQLPRVPRVDSVLFGTVASPSFSVESDTRLRAVSPAHAAGTVGLTVTTDDGASTSYSDYTFVAAAAPKATVNPPASYVSGSTSPAIAGTVDDPEAQITVTVLGVSYQAINNGDGTWTLPAGSIQPLAPGEYDAMIVVASADGATATLGVQLVVLSSVSEASNEDQLAETGASLGLALKISAALTLFGLLALVRRM